MLHQPETDPFEARALDIEIATSLGARFHRDRFTFDYRRNGELLFRKVRTLDKRFWIEPAGAPLQFWNLDQLHDLPSRPAEPLVITEGEFDAIAVVQACGGFAISVPNGASEKKSEPGLEVSDDAAFRYLWAPDQKLIPEIDQFDKIILCTDDDDKGLRLRDELAIRIGEARCWYVSYPGACKDANDVLKLHGADALRKMIAEAKPLRPGYLLRYSDIPPRSLSITYSTGWEALDKHLMLRRPELMIVTGQPGHGKGQFIRSMAYHLAEAHGFKIAFLTPEDPPDRHKADMMRFALRQSRFSTQDERNTARQWVDEHFFISLPPEDEPITLGMVMHEMEAAALHHDCQVFVVDPWNEVEHEYGRGESETQYIERALRAFKRKMRRLQMILIIAAHPIKTRDRDGKPSQINLYSISGSANWKNKADHGLIIRREGEKSRIVEVCIEKSKDHELLGIPGNVWMEFDRHKTDYVAIPKPEGDRS